MPAQPQLTEQTPVPLKLVAVIVGGAISAAIPLAIGWTMLSARLDRAEADVSTMKIDRPIWEQDRIDNASFKAEVMTKLDRIERKIDRETK